MFFTNYYFHIDDDKGILHHKEETSTKLATTEIHVVLACCLQFVTPNDRGANETRTQAFTSKVLVLILHVRIQRFNGLGMQVRSDTAFQLKSGCELSTRDRKVGLQKGPFRHLLGT
jgi:hypothetical protein